MSRFLKNPVSKFRGTFRPLCINLPKDSVAIQGAELRTVLVNALTATDVQILIMDDEQYFMPRKDAILKLLSHDGTKHYVFKSEGGDCDNYARVLCGRVQELCFVCDCKAGPAFGTAQGNLFIPSKNAFERHALNIVVCSDLSVWLAEPQSGTLYKPHPDNKYDLIVL